MSLSKLFSMLCVAFISSVLMALYSGYIFTYGWNSFVIHLFPEVLPAISNSIYVSGGVVLCTTMWPSKTAESTKEFSKLFNIIFERFIGLTFGLFSLHIVTYFLTT